MRVSILASALLMSAAAIAPAAAALQAGADLPVGDGPYFLNFDVKKVFLATTMKAVGDVVCADANLDPWIIGAGMGIRF